MKVNLHTPIEEVQVQLIPFIDVIFCILTFFILGALQFTRQQAINVDLPKGSTGTGAGANPIVYVDPQGKTYIEQQPVEREELAQRLKLYFQQNPNNIVVLNASQTASYNDVIQILDLLRQVGGNRVSLGIKPGPSSSPTNLPNQPTVPYFPNNPAGVPTPYTPPIPGINPQGEFNPNLPSTPNQFPLPTTPNQPTGQGISPINPGINPVVPNQQAPQVPQAPGKTNTNPKR
ncbi:biopolymer transporter ExbD [Nostoc sp. CENA67]|uniref:Biopolymer transporter ExbD n=1 Tax=Amazonocrinis nigriterrae CENA67 TaxID=2794033 RepID=A0A8J7HWE1_9NOST|nr:biopolymer transporter ExbD [Amazonocrinis nigriterrae]MBH8563609.1 biopolymer transporter ExbD [Amazonocrinis nigriterrae CENA67]